MTSSQLYAKFCNVDGSRCSTRKHWRDADYEHTNTELFRLPTKHNLTHKSNSPTTRLPARALRLVISADIGGGEVSDAFGDLGDHGGFSGGPGRRSRFSKTFARTFCS